jgi:hypothetical protein
VSDPLERILGKLDGMSERLAVVETRQDANDTITNAIQTLERDVNGIGRKVDMHEGSAGHGVTLVRLEAIEAAVGEIKEWRATRKALEDHIAAMADRRRRDWFQTGGTVIALAALLWKVYAG